MHHTCQTPICSDGTVNDYQGHNCDLLTEVVDAHATKLAQHTDDVETLQRTLEPHHKPEAARGRAAAGREDSAKFADCLALWRARKRAARARDRAHA